MQRLTFALMFHRAPKSREDPTPQAMAQSIRIATVIAPDADGFSHGTVMWKMDSGTGIFAGVTGAITSNFLVNLATDELFDYHFYLLYLP